MREEIRDSIARIVLLLGLAGLLPASFLLAHFGGELTSSSLNRAMFALLLLCMLTTLPLILKIVVNHYRRRRRAGDGEVERR